MIRVPIIASMNVEAPDPDGLPSPSEIQDRVNFLLSENNAAERDLEGYYVLSDLVVMTNTEAATAVNPGENAAAALRAEYDTDDGWGQHPRFSMDEWREHVAAGSVRTGYWEWVAAHLEQERDGTETRTESEEG